MTNKDIQKILIQLLEKQGCVIPEQDNNDVVLTDYITDSMTYMLFLISVEEYFGITIPDECLSIDFVSSFIGFSNAIYAIINQ